MCSWRLNPFPISFCTLFISQIYVQTSLLNYNWNDENLAKFSDNETVELLLYGSLTFDSDQNHEISSSCVGFVLKSERFDGSLL